MLLVGFVLRGARRAMTIDSVDPRSRETWRLDFATPKPKRCLQHIFKHVTLLATLGGPGIVAGVVGGLPNSPGSLKPRTDE